MKVQCRQRRAPVERVTEVVVAEEKYVSDHAPQSARVAYVLASRDRDTSPIRSRSISLLK